MQVYDAKAVPYDHPDCQRALPLVAEMPTGASGLASLIQRRLPTGYNNACRILEQMEAEGVVIKLPDGRFAVSGPNA